MRHYLALITLLPLILIGIYASAIWVIDPYGFYRPDTRIEANIKPAMIDNQNMAKSQIVKETHPETVIIGSSRVDFGINPNHPFFNGSSVYNYGLSGIRIIDLEHVIRHAVLSGATHIVWGLDFYGFNAHAKPPSDFTTNRLLNGNNNPSSDMNTLISISSFWPAIQALKADNHSANTMMNGQQSATALDHKTETIGTDDMMRATYSTFLNNLYFPAPTRSFAFATDDQNDSFTAFDRPLKFLQNHNIKLTLFIAPQHASHYALIHHSGLMNQYTTWKDRLHTIATSYDFDIHDLTTINAFTTEDTTQPMVHYWESSHYKPIIGNMILDALQGKNNALKPISLDQFQNRLTQYECDHPTIVNDIRNAVITSGLENHLIPPPNCR